MLKLKHFLTTLLISALLISLLPIQSLAAAAPAKAPSDHKFVGAYTLSNSAITTLKISSIGKNKSAYTIGDTAKITIKAYGSPTKASISHNGKVVASATKYTTSGSLRIFTLYVDLKTAGKQSLKLSIQTSIKMVSYTTTVTVYDNAKASAITPNKKNYVVGDTAKITVKTYGNASKVWLRDEYGNNMAAITKYTTSGQYRIFTINWSLVQVTGTRNVKIIVQNAAGKGYAYGCKLVVGSSKTSPLSVYSISTNKSSYTVGETASITIKTYGSATKAWIRTSSGSTLASMSKYSVSGSTRTFALSFKVPSSGYNSLRIVIQDSSGRTITYSFSVNVTSSPSPSIKTLKITSATPDNTNYSVGDIAKISVVTTGDAIRTWIRDENNNDYAITNSYNTSGSSRIFNINWTQTKEGIRTVRVMAMNSSGEIVSYNIVITVKGNLKITRLDVHPPTITLGDSTLLTVETSTSATKLWVYDNGNTYATTTQYKHDIGATRTWEINWTPTTSGTQTAYLYASDAAGNTISKEFAIKVNPNSTIITPLKIFSATATSSTVSSGSSTSFEIQTSVDITRITLTAGSDTVSSTTYSDVGGVRYWTINFNPSSASPGSLTVNVAAYDNTNNKVESQVTLTIVSSTTTPVLFTNPSSSYSMIIGGGSTRTTVTFNIETNAATDKVEIYLSGTLVAQMNMTLITPTQISWSSSVNIHPDSYDLTYRLYNSSGQHVSFGPTSITVS